MSDSKELIVSIEPGDASKLFVDGGTDDLLKQVEEFVLSIAIDPNTAKGRDEIKSLAYRVARTRTTLDGIGKDFVADLKAQAKVVDNERKKAREFLEELQAKVRAPVTEWEQEHEKAENTILSVQQLASFEGIPTSDEVRERIETLRTIDPEDIMEDRREELTDIIEQVGGRLSITLADRERMEAYEAQQTEEAQKKAEAERKAREEEIAKKAAEDARKAAEAEAARKAQEAAKQAERDREAARKRIAVIRRYAQDVDAEHPTSGEIQRQLRLFHQAAALESPLAPEYQEDEREAITETRNALERMLAVAREREAEDEARKAEERRQANTRHRNAVNQRVNEGLCKFGIDQATADDIIEAINEGRIPDLSINY